MTLVGGGGTYVLRLVRFLASCLALVIVGSFALLALGPARAQRCGPMVNCWLGQFPHWDKPWTVPAWALFSTLDMVRYCFEPTGHVLALIAFLGAAVIWRSGQK